MNTTGKKQKGRFLPFALSFLPNSAIIKTSTVMVRPWRNIVHSEFTTIVERNNEEVLG